MRLRALLSSAGGERVLREEATTELPGDRAARLAAASLGERVAEAILGAGGDAIVAELRAAAEAP